MALASRRPPVLRLVRGGAPCEPARDEQVERAVSLMREDLTRRWTVRELARKVGLSRPVFARRFVAATGSSPARYLARLRLEEAARVLGTSQEGLAQVAARVGYASEFAFNRAFKRMFRIAPGAFRARSASPVFRMAA